MRWFSFSSFSFTPLNYLSFLFVCLGCMVISVIGSKEEEEKGIVRDRHDTEEAVSVRRLNASYHICGAN